MQHGYDKIPSNYENDDLHGLDQSEKEHSRMISQHMTYHRTLMDDLMRLSSTSGSGSGSGPRDLLQQQINQANQANIVRGLGITIGNLNANDQSLIQSTSNLVDDTKSNAKKVVKLDNDINQSYSKLNQAMDSYQALMSSNAVTEVKEGYVNPSVDAALEVSDIVKESHKYALVIFGILATCVLYKTLKHL